VLDWRSVGGGGWAVDVDVGAGDVLAGDVGASLALLLGFEVRASKSEIMIGRPTKSFMKIWVVVIAYGVFGSKVAS
jgi:hypothetical protein